MKVRVWIDVSGGGGIAIRGYDSEMYPATGSPEKPYEGYKRYLIEAEVDAPYVVTKIHNDNISVKLEESK